MASLGYIEMLFHFVEVYLPITVNKEDLQLPSPFTKAPTQSLIFEREKQAKEKANPPGASKILTKAREKAKQQEAQKVRGYGKTVKM